MLKCHPITAFMKTHANFKKIFLIRVFWFKYIFPIKLKIRTLDLMLLLKNSVPFEGIYYSMPRHTKYIGVYTVLSVLNMSVFLSFCKPLLP